jgi:hypothetical protein
MKDSCDSLTGFGSLRFIFFFFLFLFADMTIVDVLNGFAHTFGFYLKGEKSSYITTVSHSLVKYL